MALQSTSFQLLCRIVAILLLFFGTERMADAFSSPLLLLKQQRNPSTTLSRQPHFGGLKDNPILDTVRSRNLPVTTSLSCGLLDAIQNALGGGNSETATKATASHILIQNKAPASRSQLERLKAEIGNDAIKFGEIAAQYSDCSSASKGGDLGEFGKGQMAKEFEKVVFDSKTPIGVVQGPISTEFGYHLILVKRRS